MDLVGLDTARLGGLRDDFGRLTDEVRAAERTGDPQEAAKAFESVLAQMMVKELRRGLPERMFGDGPGADAYEAWFDEHLAQSLAERDVFGLAGMIKTSLGRMQERLENASPTEPS